MQQQYDGMLMSMLDNDAYKFTMQQFVLHNHPKVEVEYEFKVRSDNMGSKLATYSQMIKDEIYKMCDLKLSKEEIKFLKSSHIFKNDYVNWLSNFKYDPINNVKINNVNGELNIIIKGIWSNVILYEVPILAIVSEIASKVQIGYDEDIALKRSFNGIIDKMDKIKSHELSKKFKFADFGTRRRLSAKNQDLVVSTFAKHFIWDVSEHNQFVGTSNVHLARIHNVKFIGTMAHELFMAYQVLAPLNKFQGELLDMWNNEYEGALGIALTDTIGVDSFLKEFHLGRAKLYDGVRHDSGDPVEFGEKVVEHYISLGIDPLTKSIIFSDGLTIDKALELLSHFDKKINVSFGIGTHLTNDVEGISPTSMVIKIQEVEGCPVAKISDEPIKAICRSSKFLEYLKELYQVSV